MGCAGALPRAAVRLERPEFCGVFPVSEETFSKVTDLRGNSSKLA
jgi:hypothetical protein